LVKLVSTYDHRVVGVVLENAQRNAKYISPTIQKEILHIIASKMQNAIREEIGDAKFCIIIDEAWDESKREQMANILRFVDKDGFLKKRLFYIVHVRDTTALTLKKKKCAVFSRYNLHIENIRGRMMGLVICVVNGLDYKLYFLLIVHMHITCIVWLTWYN
jgi:hypothetical protein